HLALDVAWRKVVVIVEPNLADRADLVIGGDLPDESNRFVHAPGKVARLMGMDAARKLDGRPDRSHPASSFGFIGVARGQDAQGARDTRAARTSDNGL